MINSMLRIFKSAKQYYLTTILTLSLTISMVLSVFSLVDLVYFSPLPYANSDNLYVLDGTISRVGETDSGVGTNPQIIEHIRKNNDFFTEMAIYHQWS